jgi:hypothetical protein
VTKNALEYYNGNLMDLAAIRAETCTFGAEAAELTSKLAELTESCTHQKAAVTQVEGQASEDKSDRGYHAICVEVQDRSDGRDLRMLRGLICKELETAIASHRPGIASLVFSGSSSAERWRSKGKEILRLHGVKCERPSYDRFMQELNRFQKELYRDKVLPNLEMIGKCMKQHLVEFREVRHEVESRIRTIEKGLGAFHRFSTSPTDDSVIIPDRWYKKLMLPASGEDKCTLKTLKRAVYDRHMQLITQ